MASRLVLARHGLTNWNVEERMQGHQGASLNNLGRAQAHQLAEQLQSEVETIDIVISSDLQRAVETATIVAEFLKIPLQLDLRLRECTFGSLEGLTRQEIISRYGEELRRHLNERTFDYDFRPFGGECRKQVVARHLPLINALREDKKIRAAVLVGHGRSLNDLRAEFWPDIPYIDGNCVYRVVKL